MEPLAVLLKIFFLDLFDEELTCKQCELLLLLLFIYGDFYMKKQFPLFCFRG